MDNGWRALGVPPWPRHADRLALHAASGIGQRGLVGALGDRHALNPDQQPLAVHHREHRLEPAIGLADAPADRSAILAVAEDAGGRSVDAELLFKPQRADVVALAGPAVFV